MASAERKLFSVQKQQVSKKKKTKKYFLKIRTKPGNTASTLSRFIVAISIISILSPKKQCVHPPHTHTLSINGLSSSWRLEAECRTS